MTWLGKILFGLVVLILVSIVVSIIFALPGMGQVVEIDIPNPGAAGMVTFPDADLVGISNSSYTLNIDVTSRPGVIQPRPEVGELTRYDSISLYGAFGYYNNLFDHKLIVGITDTVFIAYYADTQANGNPYTRISFITVGQVVFSDTAGISKGWSSTGDYVFPDREGPHDWLQYGNILIHCDDKTPPLLFTTTKGFPFIDTTFWRNDSSWGDFASVPGDTSVDPLDSVPFENVTDDTLGFGPRLLSMGLEAPGQLRVGVLDEVASLDGMYRYSYAYYDTLTDSVSEEALWSAVVLAENEAVYLTQFERYDDTSKAKEIIVIRERLDGNRIAFVIDTIGRPLANDTMPTSGLVKFRDTKASLCDATYPNSPYHILCQTVRNTWEIIIELDSGSFADTIQIENDRPGEDTCCYTRQQLMDLFYDSLTNTGTHATINDSLVFSKIGDDAISIQSLLPCFFWSLSTSEAIRIEYLDSGGVGINTPVIVYKDTVSDALATERWDKKKVSGNIYRPGQLRVGDFDSDLKDSTPYGAYNDSVYAINYSFVDPITGIESPLGPTTLTMLADSILTDTVRFRNITTGWPAEGRPGWIKLYQGVMKSDLTGGGDSSYRYALYRVRTNGEQLTIPWGNWSDVAVTTGLDSSLIRIDTVYDYQFVRNILGVPPMLPPYSYDLQVTVTEIEGAHDRLYATGDKLNPNSIWFTPVDSLSWYPLDVYSVEPGEDEFVAMVVINGTLYCLKHNSIWYIAGYAAEIEEMWGKTTDDNIRVRLLSKEMGAVSKRTVLEADGVVYFLTPELDMLSMNGVRVDTISTLISDRIDSLFFRGTVGSLVIYRSLYESASKYANMFKVGDLIVLQNDSTGVMLAYNRTSRTWGYISYEDGYIPTGSFAFDTTLSLRGRKEYTDILYADTSLLMRVENYSRMFSDANQYEYPWAWESPPLTGGADLWKTKRVEFSYEFADTGSGSVCWLRYNIYNSTGDSLCSDSVLLKLSDNKTRKCWDVQRHSPDKYLTFRFWAQPDDQYQYGVTEEGVPLYREARNNLIIKDVKFLVRYAGKERRE